MKFNISKYLYTEYYNKDYLNNKYDEFLSKNELNKYKFEKILYNVLANINIENLDENLEKKDSKIIINIDSPLFIIISKINKFENNYEINI